ncbi:DUF6541 family protein [Cellulomonas terrae]|uniref:Uncharacterized protein n=1 Tax=Cellulomonas terrae TaxID=311234 RepID=A0A511JHL6_9CELL|nr:DUF6541 family protein [Cellulomonas terrae]GEL97163.1 hypothetical protein CTE05_07100 [Cellulomonas terrae]
MEWLGAIAAAVLVLLAYWGPGLALLWAWGGISSWIVRWAVAPLLTLGLFGAATIVLDGWVPWHLGTALVVLALATLPAALVRRLRSSAHGPDPRRTASPAPRLLAPVVAGVVLLQLLAVAIAVGRPGRLLTAYDAIFHLNGIEHIRQTSSASSFRFTALYSLTDTTDGSFYGAAWHAVAALVPRVTDASTIATAALVVPALLAWTTGIVFVTRTALPARPSTWTWAALLSTAGLGLPLYLGLSQQGLVANAMGAALVPALVALVPATTTMQARRRVPLLATATIGVGLCHPNAVLGAAVVLAPWAVYSVVVVVRRSRAQLAAVAALTLGASAALLAMTRTDSYVNVSGVAATEGDAPLPTWVALIQVVSGNGTYEGTAAGFVVGAAAIVGCILGRRLPRARWAVLACAGAVTWYLLATSRIPLLRDVDLAWYGEGHRFAPVLAATLVPPAALAVDAVWRRLVLLVARSGRPRAVATGAVLLLVAVPVGQTALGTAQVVGQAFRDSDGRGLLADDAELAMMHRLPTEITGGGAVYGSPFSGASHLYGLAGLPVVPRSWHTPSGPASRYVAEHLADLGHDPGLCRALDTLGVRFLYVDSQPWNSRHEQPDVRVAPSAGVRLVDRGGAAAVYVITACD